MTQFVMKSLKLNPENPRHKKAIDVLKNHGKNSQALIVDLLIQYGNKKVKCKKTGGLFDDN